MRPAVSALLLASSLWAACAAQAQDGKACAIVLMHGKWGAPQSMATYARKLDPPCVAKSIEMPWSQRRNYDVPYPAALQDVAAQVKAFREQGYKRVLVGGQSFGANAALAYMAEVGDADGVIALSPGHVPEGSYRRGIGKEAVDKARELVAAGKGGETLSMDDVNQGQRRSIRMSAEVLQSYFDPQGLGNMPRSAARFRKAVPVFWVVSTNDPLFAQGEGFAYNRLPPDPKSRFVAVESDHFNALEVAAPQLVEWLKALD